MGRVEDFKRGSEEEKRKRKGKGKGVYMMKIVEGWSKVKKSKVG